jgi:FkbM family methyltransferase
MGTARDWIPIPTILPLQTFPKRLMFKWRLIVGKVFNFFGVKLGLLGSRFVGMTDHGNARLKLNVSNALGVKGTIIELPRDLTIYESVKNFGSWELEVSKFLAGGLRKACQKYESKTALLDIGANTGLITLQAMNLSKTNNECFLFEPVPRHSLAINHNLSNIPNIHLNSFALSDKDGKSYVFTESSNHGNTSLLNSVVPEKGSIRTEIELVDTQSYCQRFLDKFDSYVIKCDTQGMDALILARIPSEIWQKTVCAVIEVWALPEIVERDVDDLLSMCQEFKYVGWSPDSRPAEFHEIKGFWLGKSGNTRNLFLSNY